MKKYVKRIFCILMIFTLVLGSFFVVEPIRANAEIVPASGVVSISNLAVSNSSPGLGDTISYSFDFSSSVDIVDIDIHFQFGEEGDVSIGMNHSGNNAWTAFTIDGYGQWNINYILFIDANNNQYCLYNTSASAYMPPGGTGMDMSWTNIIVNPPEIDTQKPTIDASTLRVDSKTYNVGDRANVYIEITDNDGISSVGYVYYMGNGTEVSGGAVNVGGDTWKFDIKAEVPGNYTFAYITATDYTGNKTAVYSTDYTGYRPVEGETASMSAGAFKAVASNTKDKTPPVIHVDTLSVSKTKVELDEKVVLSVKISDESKINRLSPFIQMGKAGICEMSGALKYNSATGKYEIILDSEYYGIWELMGIYAVDSNGNETLIYNSNMYSGQTPYGYFGDPTAKKDMSNSVFYVGITDADTGVFITGNGMSNNVKFDAKHLSKNGNAYDKLYKKGYNVEKFMELKVSGNYSEQGEMVKVEFPVDSKSGSKVLIKHLRPNGSIQEEAKTVYGSKVSMYVSDFSPFMILSTDSGKLLAEDQNKLNDSNEDKAATKKYNDTDQSFTEVDGNNDESTEGKKGSLGNKSRAPSIGIVVGVVACLIVAGGGGLYYYKKKK